MSRRATIFVNTATGTPPRAAIRDAPTAVGRRIFALLAALAMVVTALFVPPPPPAQAALHNIFPADADGTPQGVFYADSALFATMTSDLTGGRVCVVSETVTNPSTANCVSGVAWGSPNTYIGMGTLAGYPLSAPPLPVGTWRLLITDLSGKTGTEVSETFEVRPCAGTCDTSAATSQLAPWKAKAATAGDTVESLDYIGAADKAMSLYNNLAGVLTDVVKGGGPVGVLMGIGTGMVEGMFANPWDKHKDLAMSILRPLHATSYRMWGDISRDPPRDDYNVDTQPVFRAVPTLAADDFEPALDAAELGVMTTYAQLTMEAAAYGDASRFANERYMGAMEDEAYEAAEAQARATANFTFQLNQRLRALDGILSQVAAMAWAQQSVFPDPTALFDVPADQTADAFFQDLVTAMQATFTADPTGGISAEDRASLKACEFYETPPAVDDCPITDEMIDYSAAMWQDADYVAGWRAWDTTASPADVLTAYAAELDGIIETYDLFGRWMGLKAGEALVLTPAGQPNRKPASAFTQSRTEGAAPLTVTFTSTATDPDGDVLSLHWDIAGARQVYDEGSVVHTFAAPGTYWIGLTATDPDGLWDQAIAKVEVYPGDGTGGTEPVGNQVPVAAFTPTNPVLGPPDTPPYVQTFSAIGDDPASPLSYDPDGDDVTYTWHFGDGSSYSGPTVTKQFDEGFVMSVLLVVSDGWKTAQASGEVTANWSDGAAPDGNHPPTVALAADPDAGAPPLQVLFTATASDEDDDTLTYHWDFGDGQADGNKQVVAHTYAQPGTYQVTVTVSDGQATATATQVVAVAAPPAPLAADWAVSGGYDAASALSGARLINTGVASNPSYPVTNLMMPTGEWRTPNTATGEQTIIIDLAGGGRDLLDRVALTGYNATTSVKAFSVALTAGDNPFAGYRTVIDHAELAQAAGEQTFSFPAQTARFLKLTVHDNRGGAHLRLAKMSVPTAGRDGGIVSLNTGVPATATASSEYSAPYAAGRILGPDDYYWSTPYGLTTDQTIRVALGGEGPHTLGSIALRGSTSTRSVNEFEVWASTTGDDGSFTPVLTGTLERIAALQTFDLPTPVSAAYLELRLKNNHGDANYLYLYELRALTTDGLNVAHGSGVGAQIMDASSFFSSSYDPENALAAGTSGAWRSASGQVTDQHLTVILRHGEIHTVDHVEIEPGPYRPRNVEVQVSTDGATFTTVADRQLLDTTAAQTMSFPPVDARFVRLVIKDGYHATYVGLQRLRVFAADRGDAAAVPFVDISTASPVAWHWDFGDGSTSDERHPLHTFPGTGSYSVTLTVTDAHGDTATITRPYTVPGLPTLTIGAATDTVNEGASVPLTGSTDGIPIVQWEWDLDYIKPSSTSASVTARFPDDGTYTVRVRGLTADWIWTPWAGRTFTVLNVAPTVTPGPAASVLVGDPIVPVGAGVTDPADSLTCTWNWGDGSATETVDNCTSTRVRVPHVYAVPGVYTATLTADDGDGGVTSASLVLTALIRPTFLQVTEVAANGDNLAVTVRLVDSSSGQGISARSVHIGADSAAPLSATTDALGFATVTLPGSSAATAVSATFAGSTVYAESSLTRAVRAPRADIVFVVDESGSMGGVQSAVRAHLQLIARGLGASLDYRLGVVGYAGTDRQSRTFGHVHSALSDDVSEFYRGSGELVATSASANGYEGLVVGSGYQVENNDPEGALVDTGEMVFRPTAASCIVLITDAGASEIPGATPNATREHAEQALASRDSTVFAVITTDELTRDTYGPGPGLAGHTGGDWWPISEFVADPAEVLSALVSQCVTKAATPDLAVSISGPATVQGSGGVLATVTATNNSAIDTPEVTVSATLPVGWTFDSASHAGVFDPVSGTVSWPRLGLDAGAHVDRTVTMHLDSSTLDPGDHPFDIGVQVTYNGSLGEERTLDNNSATHTVTVKVPHRHDVGIAATTPGAAEAGGEVTYTLTVTNHGTTDAAGVWVLQRIPDRLRVVAVDVPVGWTNVHGLGLVGPHPDGATGGTWLHVTAGALAESGEISVKAVLLPLAQPAVIDDEGPLDSDLPPLAQVPADSLTSPACVVAEQDSVAANNCAAVAVALKDIVAQVTVRLFGGITYLIVSVDASAALDGMPVTLTWAPGEGPGQQGPQQDPVVLQGLETGRNYVIAWPGGTVDDNGSATDWPGWRPIGAADRDGAGALLDPLTGEVMGAETLAEKVRGDWILDLTMSDAVWRAPSTVTFSVNPSVSLVVNYREIVPVRTLPGDDERPTTVTEPPRATTEPTSATTVPTSTTTAPTSTTTAPTRSTTEPGGISQPATATHTTHATATVYADHDVQPSGSHDGRLASTGVRGVGGLVGGALVVILLGWLLLAGTRRGPRTAWPDQGRHR